MTDVLIRDLPESVLRAADAQAAAMGMSRHEWLRAVIIEFSALPVVKPSYRLHAYSALGLAADIERMADGVVHHQEYGLTEEGNAIVTNALPLVKRNAPGDREHAVAE